MLSIWGAAGGGDPGVKVYDVAVIGAGPAGGVAATLCARSGFKTILVEKKKLPRVKPCAGGLTARCIALLREIDCFQDPWVQKKIHQLMIHYPRIKTSVELKSAKPYLGTVHRPDFDMAMADLAGSAGASIKESEYFVEYAHTSDGRVVVQTDTSVFCTRILIGADGCRSRVRRQLSAEMGVTASTSMMYGIACDVFLDEISCLRPDCCHLFFQMGKNIHYGWGFPKKQVMNIGLVFHAADGFQQIKTFEPLQALKQFLQTIAGKTLPWRGIGAAPIPIYAGFRRSVIQKNNVLLVGDAAGFADAWTGEGIYFGVKSAVLAHQVIRKALADQNPDECLSMYAKLCKKHICRELKMSYWVSELFKINPFFYEYLQYPGVRNLFVPHTQGKISYPQAMAKAFLFVLGYKLGLLKNLKSSGRQLK